MRILFIILPLILLFNCSTDKKEGRVVTETTITSDSISDTVKVLKDSIIPVEEVIDFNDIPASKDVHERLIYFKDKYLVNYAEIDPEQLSVYVLDRFTSDKKYKLFLQKKIPVNYGKIENIFPVLNLRAYVYTDSAQCANAVNNWFNCFGNDCNAIVPGEEMMVKSTPGYYIINPTSIICLDFKVEHEENNWKDVMAHLKKLFAGKSSKIIKVKPQGKLSWEQK